MNRELLYKLLDKYMTKVNLDNNLNDLEERLEKSKKKGELLQQCCSSKIVYVYKKYSINERRY